MSDFAVFDSSGEIILMIRNADTALAAKQPLAIAHDFIEVASDVDDLTHFVDVVNRVSVQKGDYTLEALPTPCVATIEGVEYQITEQPIFEFAPGPVAVDYTISIDAGIQYLKKEFVIHVDTA